MRSRYEVGPEMGLPLLGIIILSLTNPLGVNVGDIFGIGGGRVFRGTSTLTPKPKGGASATIWGLSP